MGIQGLIPFLRKSSRQTNIKAFAGCTVAVDAYCWLHKGSYSCADKLAKGEPTDGYVHYCMKMINMLLASNVIPIMVLDGRNLPAKGDVEKKRRALRKQKREAGKAYLREGKLKEARECFQRSVDITPEMAQDLIKACQEKGIDCIVAPYEADAQLAYLNKVGIAQVVITEDSDLVLFGCDQIMFKLDAVGNGVLVEKSKLHLSMGLNATNFTFEKFRRICILSGCDYLPSLPGIGLQKSCKFFKLTVNSNVNEVLTKLPSYLNMPNLNVTDEYIEGFIRAERTFLHQLVYDPSDRKMVPLNAYPSSLDTSNMEYAGIYISEDLAFQTALGNINFQTLQKVNTFDPDQPKCLKSPSWQFPKSSHCSIWSPRCKASKKQVKQIPIVLTQTKSTKGKEEVVNVHNVLKRKHIAQAEELLDLKGDDTDNNVVDLYQLPPRKKMKKESLIEKENEPALSAVAKVYSSKQPADNSSLKESLDTETKNNSKLSVISPVVRSRFFIKASTNEPKLSKKSNLGWFDAIAKEYDNNAVDCMKEKADQSEASTKDENSEHDKNEVQKDTITNEAVSKNCARRPLTNFTWKNNAVKQSFQTQDSSSCASTEVINLETMDEEGDHEDIEISSFTQEMCTPEINKVPLSGRKLFETSTFSKPKIDSYSFTPMKKTKLAGNKKGAANFGKKRGSTNKAVTAKQDGLRQSSLMDVMKSFHFKKCRKPLLTV